MISTTGSSVLARPCGTRYAAESAVRFEPCTVTSACWSPGEIKLIDHHRPSTGSLKKIPVWTVMPFQKTSGGRATLIGWKLLIEFEIEFEHIDSCLTENSKLPSFGVFRYQSTELVDGGSALLGNALQLKFSRRRRDVRIKPRSRGGHEIDGNGDPGLSTCAVATSLFTRSISFWFVGPRLDPLELAASYPLPAAEGRG